MKKFAKVLACVLALTMVSSFALAGNADDCWNPEDQNNATVLFGTDETTGEANGYLNLNGYAVTDCYGVQFTVTLDEAEIADESAWIGGGIGFNSTSTGWASHEWGKASGEKEIVLEDCIDGTTAVIKFVSDAPIFAAEDEWAQAWFAVWGGTVTVTGVDVLGADGQPLGVATDAPATDAPTTDAPATDAPATDAPATDSTPATGDATSIVALAVVAVLAMGGVVVSSKKRA